MLDSMTHMQFQEWLAFFKIRDSKNHDTTGSDYEDSPAGQQRMATDLKAKMLAFQGRQDKRKAG